MTEKQKKLVPEKKDEERPCFGLGSDNDEKTIFDWQSSNFFPEAIRC